jgi:hypothetical protein
MFVRQSYLYKYDIIINRIGIHKYWHEQHLQASIKKVFMAFLFL